MSTPEFAQQPPVGAARDVGIGQHQTTLSYGWAGFEDLTHRLGLYRGRPLC